MCGCVYFSVHKMSKYTHTHIAHKDKRPIARLHADIKVVLSRIAKVAKAKRWSYCSPKLGQLAPCMKGCGQPELCMKGCGQPELCMKGCGQAVTADLPPEHAQHV